MRPGPRAIGGVLAMLPVLAAAAGHPQPQVLRSGIEVVQVTATVRDAGGRLVGDLGADDFEVFDDGVPQAVTQFQRGRVPVSLGILLDVSESMYGQRMGDASLALDRFLVDLLEPTDEVFLVVFNHDPRLEELSSWPSTTASTRSSRPAPGTATRHSTG